MNESNNDVLIEDTEKSEGTSDDLSNDLEGDDQEDLDAWDIEEDLEE